MFKARNLNRAKRGLWQGARAAGARANDIEVAVSDFTLEQLLMLPHADRQVRIYNGIDASQYSVGPDVTLPQSVSRRPVVGFAGRLIAGKGADYLIEAIARVRQTDEVSLRIAGDGPERRQLETLVRDLSLEDEVSFLGWCDDVRGFWAECDIAAVPSAEFIESCPMTLLEAMTCGKPVVASRNGGLQELVVDGETGALATPCDPAALAELLRSYVRSDALRRTHGAASRALVEGRFRIRDCAESYLALFDELGVAR
jgi:glycosyltransferase involved in cell wall biosynthesis